MEDTGAILGLAYFGALSSWAIAVALAADAQAMTSSAASDPRRPPRYTFGFAIALAATWTRSLHEALAIGVACLTLVFGSRLAKRADRVMLPSAVMIVAVSLLTARLAFTAGGAVVVGGCAAALSLAFRRHGMGRDEVYALAVVGSAFGPIQSAFVAGFALAFAAVAAVLRRNASDGTAFRRAVAFGACATLVFGDYVEHVWLRRLA